MKLYLRTLIDITETGERKGPNKLAIGQQSNYDSMIASLGLRANPEPLELKQFTTELTEDIGFGSAFEGEHTYWQFEFAMPESAVTKEMLIEDFDLVPIVTDLNETVHINISVFQTKDTANRNIVFNISS